MTRASDERPGVGPNRFGALLGVEILEASPQAVRARVEIDDRHHQPYGTTHGGVYCAIVEDVASHGAGQAALAAGVRGVLGVSNHTDFFRTHRGGELQVRAEPVHVGRTQQLWEVQIRRPHDQALVARGQVRFTMLEELPTERA